MEEIYVAKKLVKKYKSGDGFLYALNEVDLTLYKTEVTTILGPSGSGKTTLLNSFITQAKISNVLSSN